MLKLTRIPDNIVLWDASPSKHTVRLMEVLKLLESVGSIPGIKNIIKKSFISVFDELNIRTETWFEKTKILTTGKDEFSEFIIDNIASFPLFGVNATANVTDSYIQLQISSEINREIYKPINIIEENLKKRECRENTIEGILPVRALEGNNKGFALLGNPGSGKTTAFRYIAFYASQGNLIRGKTRLPIYLAVRNLVFKKQTILEACADFFDTIGVNYSDKVTKSLFKNNKLLILLDGLDETDSESQKTILFQLKELRERYKENIFCVSARPYSLSVGLNGFQKWETLPLDLANRIEFIGKWFDTVSHNKKSGIMSIIKENPNIIDLGSNPLLLSIICALYYNDLNIPKNIDELYGRCLEGMLGGWDAFRTIARSTVISDLSITQRKVLVSFLAAYLFQNNKIVFSPQDIREYKIINEVEKTLRCDLVDADELLKSLYNDFGIIIEQAPSLYSFSHLTFHEYLTALYIVNQRQEIMLLSSFRKNLEWREVIKLVARMLPNADEYLKNLMHTIDFSSEAEVDLLEKIWLTEPICSRQVSKSSATKILQIISSSSKTFSDAKFIFENGLLVIETPRKNYQSARKKIKKQKNLHPTEVLPMSLPSLLNILYKLGFDFEDLLGNTNNKLIKFLKENESPKIRAVKVIMVAKKYRKDKKI